MNIRRRRDTLIESFDTIFCSLILMVSMRYDLMVASLIYTKQETKNKKHSLYICFFNGREICGAQASYF